MIKAALFTLGLAALLGFPGAVPAQDNPTALAVNEAVLRQANTIVLRQKLSDARATAQRGDIAVAAKLYQESCALVQQIGSGIDVETTQAVAGLTVTRLALARDAQSRGDLHEAETQIQQVLKTEKELKVTPNLNEVLAFKKQNDQMIVAMRGRMPSAPVLDQIPQMAQQKVEAGTLVQDGKLFYEMGKLPEAQAKLNDALQLDPENSGAFYYLNLIQQAKIGRDFAQHTVDTQQRMDQVEKQWVLPTAHTQLPVPNPYATNTLVYTGPGRQAIIAKLDHTRLDSFSTGEGMPLSEVLRSLSEQAKLRDPEHKGINFLINPNADKSGQPVAAAGGARGLPGAGAAVDAATGLPAAPAPAATGGGEPGDVGATMIKIPSLTDVRLAEVLDAIVLVAQPPIKYSIQDFAVVFQAKGDDPVLLSMRTFKVDPNTFYSGLQSVSSQSFGSSGGNNGGGGGGNSGGGGGNSGGGGGNSGGGGGNNNSGGGIVGIVDPFGGGAGGNQGGGGGGGGRRGGGGRGGGNQGGGTQGGGGGLNLGGAGGAGGAGGGGGGTLGADGTLDYITSVTMASTPSEAVMAFFAALGVNLREPAGKAVFFNDRLGLLFVKATEQDLDTIERAIQTLNQVAPQVHIKARFIEVEQLDSKQLGFDWYMGQFNLGNQARAQGGTAGTLNVPVTPNNYSGSFPGNPAVGTVPGTIEQLYSSGLSSTTPGSTTATITGILTDPNFQVVLHALESRSGIETLAEPEATTTSGRQVQMRATKLITVITGVEFQQGSAAAVPGVVGAGGGGG